ncbi:MAG: S8 family serine peptidase [Tenericutes bacterium]|nr:S8 family serine peptidase [Mycoplasmatota bacterium]
MKKFLVFLSLFLVIITSAGYSLIIQSDCITKIIYNDSSEFVNESEKKANEDTSMGEKYTVVHVQMNYDQYEPLDNSMITDLEADDLVRLNREKGKEYHQSKNKEISLKLGLDRESGFYSSMYTPFVTFKLDVTDEATVKTKLKNYANSDDVKVVYADVADTTNIKSEMSTMFGDIGLGSYSSYSNYNGYDGTGVVIGILEYGGACLFGSGGLVDEDHTNFVGVDLEIRNEWYCNEKESDHATLVASIAGGNAGIARGAKILSVQTDALDYSSEFDWMLDRDVNVVNMSLGDAGMNGYYTGNTAFLDFIVRNYWVSIVKSSGNNGDNITTPGTGYNIITVGALLNSSSIRSDSSWEENFLISKPNLVAPGTSISAGTAGPASGTSLLAPHVTGAIALMMDRSSTLKVHPEVVMAIIQATADSSNLVSTYNDYDSSGLEEKIGAGMLRIDRAVDFVYKRSYPTITNNDNYRTYIREKRVYLSNGDDLQASLVWLKNIYPDGTSGALTPKSSTDLDLKLFSPSGALVAYSNSGSYNQEFIRYTANSAGYYTLKIYQYGNYATYGTEYIGLAYWYN